MTTHPHDTLGRQRLGPQLTLELFNDLNASKILNVPYKGGAPSVENWAAVMAPAKTPDAV